jgi:hypothetical protein
MPVIRDLYTPSSTPIFQNDARGSVLLADGDADMPPDIASLPSMVRLRVVGAENP